LPVFELVLVLFSGLLHATWNAATKGSESPVGFLLAMEVVSLVFYLPILTLGFDPREVPGTVWALVFASSVVHAFYANWLSRTYATSELSIAYPIVRSTPAIVPLIAVPFLGESLSLQGVAGIVLVVASMWVVTTGGRIDGSILRSRGAGFAYLTLGTTVAYSLVDKEAMRLLGDAPWSGAMPRSLIFMALMYVLYLPLFAILARRSVRVAEVVAVVRTRTFAVCGAALIAPLSYTLILHAMQTAPVSYITAVRQSSVLFALVIAVVALGERPGRVRVLGGIANVVGVALIALAD
jgi:drug/metabolite transporter (DMT)-like permease